MEYVKLRNGMQLSCIGMGSYPVRKERLLLTVPHLTDGGINIIDTAHDYNNERWIGLARKFIKDKYLVSTKMSVGQQKNGGYARPTKRAVESFQ